MMLTVGKMTGRGKGLLRQADCKQCVIEVEGRAFLRPEQ